MASWRRKVAQWFPDLRPTIQRPESTAMEIVFILLARVRTAHQVGDLDTQRRIYAFANWCSRQICRPHDSAAVTFYLHLFDGYRNLWPEFVEWIPPRIERNHWRHWQTRLTTNDLAEIRHLLANRRHHRYLEAEALTRNG